MNDTLDLKFIEYNGGIKTKGFIADLSDKISAGASGKYGIAFTSDINLYASYKGSYQDYNTPFITLWHSKVDENNLCTGEYTSSNMLKFSIDGVYSFKPIIPVSDTQLNLGSADSSWKDVYAQKFIADGKTDNDILLGAGGTISKDSLLSDYYTKTEADAIHSSVIKLQGDITIGTFDLAGSLAQGLSMVPTDVGQAWIADRNTTVYENITSSFNIFELEKGDIVICVGWYDDGSPRYTVVQSNWTASSLYHQLEWGQPTNLAEVGGITITATLPAEPPKFTSITLTGDVTGSATSIDNETLTINTTVDGLEGRLQTVEANVSHVSDYCAYIESNYLPLAGGTMSGDITFGENGGILFTQVGSLTCAGQAGLELEADGCVLHLESGYIDIVGTMRNSTGTISATAFYEISDARKKDIKLDLPLDKCYDLIDKCQTVIYSLKDQTQEQIGMIAQEVEEFFPEVVATDADGFKSLAYDRLVVICFKVLKDVIKRLEKLENEN